MPSTTNVLGGFPIVTIIVFLPAVGALVCAMLEDVRQIRLTATATVVIDFILAMFMLARFSYRGLGQLRQPPNSWVFQFADKHDWISSLGITYWVGVDGVAVFLVGLATLMMAIAVIAATFMIADRVRLFMVFMLLLESGILGVFVSLNLFLFYVFWEAMLIPMYFLVGMWGEERRVYATMKFVLYTMVGSFLMLVGIFYLWAQTGTLDMPGPAGLLAHPLSAGAQTWVFLAFAIAFAIKLPLWPFHTWAPTAYTESPVPVVIALAGILSKAGAFGLLRYCVPLFPAAARQMSVLIAVLAIIGLLYAAVLALVQTDIKRIVAFASISHMNLIALGIFALNPIGFDGSVLQMINHSIIISGLFVAVAYIVARTGTRLLPQMGGLGAHRPYLMWLFFVFILAGLDLPGLSSFAGEFLILLGVFATNAWWAGIAALVTILAAWYMVRFFQNSMNGQVKAIGAGAEETALPEGASPTPSRTPYQYPVVGQLIAGDLRLYEAMLLVPMIILILYVGIQPDPLTTRMNPTTNAVSSLVHHLPPLLGPGGGR